MDSGFFDPNKVLSIIRTLLYLVEDAVSAFADSVLDTTPEDLVSSVSLSTKVSSEVVKHKNASGIFTQAMASNLARLIKNFNMEIAQAQGIIDDLNKLLKGDKLANAYVIAKSLTDAVNHIVDAINVVIGQHNTHFHDVESFKVDPVNSLVIRQ